MAIQTASVLYPVNTTTVDSGTGRDIRLLDSAQAGATDNSQTATATHTQDNQVRVFDPASAANVSTLTYGWALRLTEDMTPTDDTNCNAILLAQTIAVSLRVTINQSGGTYVTGSYGPEWRVIVAAYNPATDTLTDISGVVGNSATTWNYTPATGDLGTFKNVTFNVSVPQYEFAQGEVLMVLIGLNTLTIPNPTLGTATWTYTLSVDDANTSFTLGSVLASVCGMTGSAAGAGTASAAGTTVLPTTGSSAGVATATGALAAQGLMTGTSSGVAAASGALAAAGAMVGSSAGTATVSGSLAGVGATAGSSAGTSTAAATAAGVGAMAGSAAGTSTAAGTLIAFGGMVGSSSGVAAASGSMGAVAEATGNAAGSATALGSMAAVAPTVGTATVGEGGGEVTYPDGLLVLRNDGRVEARYNSPILPDGYMRLVAYHSCFLAVDEDATSYTFFPQGVASVPSEDATSYYFDQPEAPIEGADYYDLEC